MGMLGQWVSRPRRVEDLDSAINNADAATLDAMMKDIRDGELFLDIRDKYNFAPVPDDVDASTLASIRADDDHIRKHWFNEDEEGWWPFDPTHEIRTEAIYRVAEMVRESIKDGNRKRANSLWMCPGVDHFRCLILDAQSDIMIVYLSPPENLWAKEPLPSPHRGDYEEEVADYFKRNIGDTCVKTGPNEVLVPGVIGVNAVDLYEDGTRVRISDGEGFEIYRTVTDVRKTGSQDCKLMLRPGRGSLAKPIPNGVLRIHPLGGLNEKELTQYPQLQFGHRQNIWTIAGIGRGSKYNVREDKAVVTGVTVKQNLGQPPRNGG